MSQTKRPLNMVQSVSEIPILFSCDCGHMICVFSSSQISLTGRLDGASMIYEPNATSLVEADQHPNI